MGINSSNKPPSGSAGECFNPYSHFYKKVIIDDGLEVLIVPEVKIEISGFACMYGAVITTFMNFRIELTNRKQNSKRRC